MQATLPVRVFNQRKRASVLKCAAHSSSAHENRDTRIPTAVVCIEIEREPPRGRAVARVEAKDAPPREVSTQLLGSEEVDSPLRFRGCGEGLVVGVAALLRRLVGAPHVTTVHEVRASPRREVVGALTPAVGFPLEVTWHRQFPHACHVSFHAPLPNP